VSGNDEAGVKIPQDLIQVGYVSGAYGVNGWVRIKPHSADADALLGVKTWWIDKPHLQQMARLQVKMHSGDVVAQLMGVVGRDAAEALKGATVQVPRSHFPALGADEFYWSDLTGMTVENLQGESLGVVAGLMENGAHQILRVEALPAVAAAVDAAPVATERLIPFVSQFVVKVDQGSKKIVVDWGLDF
jgi:16S rRNA processing protein RimM